MQPSLKNVLTPGRTARLEALGWRFDPSFGNYVQTFPAEATTSLLGEQIAQVLREAYAADIATLQSQTAWVPIEPCPPRNGPTQNLAGMVNDAPEMAATAVHACAYKPEADAGPSAPAGSAAQLIGFFGAKVTAEIQRLRINAQRRVYTVFDAGIGYVQCAPNVSPPLMYCEAQSADSWPALVSVLTPERIARLHDLGFAEPGSSPNYSKEYPEDEFDDGTIAREALTLLYEVYGYKGLPPLKIRTEDIP